MKRTTAPNSVGGAFVDEVPGTTLGTTVTAEDKNLTQEEICHAIEGAGGLPLDGGSNYQLHQSVIRAAIECGRFVGDLFYNYDILTPAAFDPAHPRRYRPVLALDDIDHTIDIADWPDIEGEPGLVTWARAYKGAYNRGQASEKTDFSVTNWAIASNVVTLTFANATEEKAMLAALSEASAFMGSGYPGTITIPVTFGNVTAGDYAITSVDAVARTVTFALTAANGSGAGTWTVNFYPFRIAGSSTTAKLLKGQGVALMSANDSDSMHIGGYQRRSYLQGHLHNVRSGASLGSAENKFGRATGNGEDIQRTTDIAISDGTNGIPRTGKETEPRSINAHLHIHGGRYI